MVTVVGAGPSSVVVPMRLTAVTLDSSSCPKKLVIWPSTLTRAPTSASARKAALVVNTKMPE